MMNMCLETNPPPRRSYSFDFGSSDCAPVEIPIPSSPPSPTPVFEFGTRSGLEFIQSSADELFENGTILPSDPGRRRRAEASQRPEVRPQPLPFLTPLHLRTTTSLGDAAAIRVSEEDEMAGMSSKTEETIQQKSFWGFRRSSSLGSENGYGMSFLFPLPVLPRSTSVSSSASQQSSKRRPPSQKQQSSAIPKMAKSSSLSAYACPFPDKNYAAPLLRKSRSGGTYYGGSMKVSPVLNVPSGCNSRGRTGFFGFGCLPLWRRENKSGR